MKEENQQLKQQIAESERKLEEYKKCNCKECMTDYEKNLNQIIDKYLNENIKLKKQIHDLPKKIVEEIKDFAEIQIKNLIKFRYYADERNRGLRPINYYDLMEILNTILKKYGGEDE